MSFRSLRQTSISELDEFISSRLEIEKKLRPLRNPKERDSKSTEIEPETKQKLLKEYFYVADSNEEKTSELELPEWNEEKLVYVPYNSAYKMHFMLLCASAAIIDVPTKLLSTCISTIEKLLSRINNVTEQ